MLSKQANKMAHDHNHCHHGDCSHNQDVGDPAVVYSLYNKIDIHKVQCYNEHEEGAGKRVFKQWDQRLDTTQVQIYNYLNSNGVTLIACVIIINIVDV